MARSVQARYEVCLLALNLTDAPMYPSLQWIPNEVVAVSENGRLATSSTVIRGTTYNGVISKQSFSLEDRSRSHYFECEIETHQSGHLGIRVALASTLSTFIIPRRFKF